jgi:hypothetical protein
VSGTLLKGYDTILPLEIPSFCCFVDGGIKCYLRHCSRMSHTCSVGLRSGDWDTHTPFKDPILLWDPSFKVTVCVCVSVCVSVCDCFVFLTTTHCVYHVMIFSSMSPLLSHVFNVLWRARTFECERLRCVGVHVCVHMCVHVCFVCLCICECVGARVYVCVCMYSMCVCVYLRTSAQAAAEERRGRFSSTLQKFNVTLNTKHRRLWGEDSSL